MKNKLKPETIVIIGAGNVATHLGLALKNAGYQILQIYSRTNASAKELGEKLDVPFTSELNKLIKTADLFLFSLKDDALVSVLEEITPLSGLCIHTAGSLPMEVFKPYVSRYGVLYPLQTFSKNKEVSFSEIPVFVEADNKDDEQVLLSLAHSFSGNVQVLTSDKRKYLHLAAVFACNFANHMYTLASDILENQDLDWSLLIPLIEETADKIKSLPPQKAQTGPAVRYDTSIIGKHLDLLKNNIDQKEIYEVISKSIFKKHYN